MSPRPFRSKLLPHVDQIKRWRRSGKTWQEVADGLEAIGCKSDPGNICRFISRYNRKPYAIGAEPILESQLSPGPMTDEQTNQPETLSEQRKKQLQEEDKPKKLFDDTNIIRH